MTQSIATPIAKRDDDSGGIIEVLRMSFPLIMAASSHALKLFADRTMLSHYSSESLAASLSAGIFCFFSMTFFMGISGYTNTFVAQYTGAGREDRVGASVWQGIYLALFGGLVLAGLSTQADVIFRWINHDQLIRLNEVIYYRILVSGAVLPLVTNAVLSFWTGRGRTWTVFAITGSTVLANVILNYLLIYGTYGFPRMGIAGAGIATLASSLLGLVLALGLFWLPSNLSRFNTFPRKTLDRDLFRRLIRFGLPNGIQFFFDVAAFNVFVQLLQRAGPEEAAASAIAFSWNAMAFIPMIGLGFTVNVLVGQSVGAEDIPHAKRSVRSARTLVLMYMGTLTTLFIMVPGFFTKAFDADPEIIRLAQRFLFYIALYLLFDGLFIVYHSAIKGAGDTHFAMWVGVGMAWCCLAVPCYILHRLDMSVWWLWGVFVFYIMTAGTVFYLRYRAGAWESMRVIEH